MVKPSLSILYLNIYTNSHDVNEYTTLNNNVVQ